MVNTEVNERVRRTMRSNKSKGTKPETDLCRAIWRSGLRGYRRNFRGLKGTPDVYFPTGRVAVFVNGCFWHRCPHCHPGEPKTNRDFWAQKFKENVRRDKRVRVWLRRNGNSVVTIWECRLRESVDREVSRVHRSLGKKQTLNELTNHSFATQKNKAQI